MDKILITGGTGHLGQKVAGSHLFNNREIRILSTKTISSHTKNITYYKANLASNTQLKRAINGVDTIIHCASNPKNFEQVDIEGTKNLLKAIDSRNIRHFIYISIVGINKSSYPYYKAKLEVENLLSASGLPYTIVRTTQFHNFVLSMIQNLINSSNDKSILKIPKGLKFQSIATQEVAELLAKTSLEQPKGLLPDFGGAQILSFEEMAACYLKQFQLQYQLKTEITNDTRHELFKSGINLCPDYTFGKETWNTFLKTIVHK